MVKDKGKERVKGKKWEIYNKENISLIYIFIFKIKRE